MITNDLRGLAAKMADCTIKRNGILKERWSYDYGVAWRGMEMLYEQTGNERYFAYIKDGMDSFVGEDGSIRDYSLNDYNLDYICDGRQILYLYKRTGEKKYLLAADTLREQLRGQPRTSDGGFWHKKCYPYQMWLDGLHMAQPFYLEYALMHNEGQQTIDDVALQLTLAYRHTLSPATGLNCHAWDESRAMKWADPESGRSAHCWGRAVGWYMVALVDVLSMLPKENPRYGELSDIFAQLSAKLLSVRVDGVWQQVIDCPEREENYLESSGSCMITYALLKGARIGALPQEIGLEAQSSYRSLVSHFVGRLEDGRVFLSKCCKGAGLGGSNYRDGSFDYYMSEDVVSYDLKGTGAFIQAACEMEKLL